MGIKHVFVSAKSDSTDTSLVRPSNWNDDHTIDGDITPASDDGAALGTTSLQWSDLYLAAGGRIYLDGDDGINHLSGSGSVVISADDANTLSGSFIRFAVDGSNRLLFRDTIIEPVTNDEISLGIGTKGFSDLFLADGGEINWNNSECRITNNTNNLSFRGSDGCYVEAHIKPLTNDAASLGTSSFAWSDLYLASGGGVYFDGGTTSANFLNDYEEGTWTPTLSTEGTDFTSVTYVADRYGRYTKIGRHVYIEGLMYTNGITVGSASGDLQIHGLPFTSHSDGPTAGSVGFVFGWAGEDPNAIWTKEGQARLAFGYRTGAAGQTNDSLVADAGTGGFSNYMMFSAHYSI